MEFLRKFFLGANGASRGAAKSRLQFVLVQDRAGLSTEEMTSFRQELVSVIEKYFVINESGFDIDYKRSGDTTTLLINSPVLVRNESKMNGKSASNNARKKGKSGNAGRAAQART